MPFTATPNLPTFELDAAAVTARNAEYSGTPFTDTDGDGTTVNPYLGCNRAGSCAPGIGINTGAVLVPNGGAARPDDFTELDQAGAARIPQDSQHIGGSGLGSGDQSNEPIRVIDDIGTDFNDTVALVVADTAAAAGAEMDTVSGAVNQTGAAVAVGDLVWGNIPVA